GGGDVNELPPKRPFSRQAYANTDLYVGARWWQESLRRSSGADAMGRRKALLTLAVLGGSAAAIGLFALLSGDNDDLDITMDALDLQRRQGWDAGHPGAALHFPNPSVTDVDDSRSWRDGLNTLAAAMAPVRA